MSLALLEPAPRVTYQLGFLSNLEQGAGTFGVLSLAFASGTLHFGTEDASNEDLEDSGSVLGRIRSWPEFVQGFDLMAPRLGLPQYQVTVDDGDGELTAVLTAEQALGTLNVQALVRIGSDRDGAGAWPTWCTLRVVDWMAAGANAVRLVLQHDHGWATRPVVQHRFLPSAFPYARADARNHPIPLAIGEFDSRASSTPGAVPAYYIDTRAGEYRFAVILGYAWAVPRVYADDVAVDSADYTITYQTIGGYGLTCIEFVSNPGADVIVRCDLTGYDSHGDGSGAPIMAPVQQLRFLCIQFGAGGVRDTANGLVDQTPFPGASGGGLFDPFSLAEVDDYLQGRRRRPRWRTSVNGWATGRTDSRYLSNPSMRVLDLINEWSLAHGVYPYWNSEGLVAFGFIDHRARRTYHDQFHYIRDEDLVEGEIRQLPSRPRPFNQARVGDGIIVTDPHSPLGSTVGLATAPAVEEIPNPWALELMSQHELVPYVTTQDSGWTETGGGTDPHDSQLVSPFAPDTVYSSWAAGTGTFRVRARLSDGPQVPQGTPALVLIRFRAKGTGTAKAGVYIGGTAYYDATVGDIALTVDWTDYLCATFVQNPDTVAAWLPADIGPDLLEVIVSATGAADVRGLRARVYALDGGPAITLARERASRAVLLGSRLPAMTEARVNLARAAIRPGDPFSISTETALGPNQEGWGLEPWERRRHVLCSAALNLNDKTCLLRAVDAHELQIPLWEHGMAQGLAPEAQGILRLGSWPSGPAYGPDGRRFSRPTADDGDPTGVDDVTAPWGQTETIPADHERYTSSGLNLKGPNTAPNPDIAPDALNYQWRHDQQSWPNPSDGYVGIFLAGLDLYAGGAQYVLWRFGSDKLYIDVDTDSLIFERAVASTYSATINVIAAGIGIGMPNTFAIAIRATPGTGGLTREDADGNEEDVPPYTLDVWIRPSGFGTSHGTADSAAGESGEVVEIGGSEGADQLEGHVQFWRAWRTLLTDDEIEAKLEVLV